MKIYTKTGDEGTTALFGGLRVPKHHIRIEAYGTVDELNSYIGLVRDHEIPARQKETLIQVQHLLFTLGSHLAATPGKKNLWVPEFTIEHVTILEEGIDEMDKELPELKHFILPGGNPAISHTHVARCICRRAERLTVLLAAQEEVEAVILQFLNRLSDYLFTLSRFIAFKTGATEIPWVPERKK